MKTTRFQLVLALFSGIALLGHAAPAKAAVRYVKWDASGANNGTSWVNAYTDLQPALAAAVPGQDEIWVAKGTYNENIQLKGEVQVYGGFAGSETSLTQRNWATNITTLDGNDAGSVVTSPSGATQETRIDGFTITNGTATVGGGMSNVSSSPTVANCRFIGNTSARGGGMYNSASAPTVTNCTFTENTASEEGGGMYNTASASPTVTNCTFSGNTATVAGGATYNSSSVPTVTNCILWGDTPDEIAYSGSAPAVTYSDVQDETPSDGTVYPGEGNIDTDPRFDAPAGNLRLGSRSPCVDAGNNTAVAGITTDLDGNPRRVDDARVNDTGPGTAPDVDMGAYERQSDSINVTLYVDDTSSGGTCRNWDDACPNLQTALGLAVSGDDIWVAAGTYKPDQGAGQTPGDRAATFELQPGVAVYGGFPGLPGQEGDFGLRDPAVNVTVLSGDIDNNDGPDPFQNNDYNSYHVVTGSGTGATAVLDGFTITAGNANGTGANELGAGMYNLNGSPTVTHCTFTGNYGSWGGGMYNESGSPTVTHCTFSENKGTRGSGMFNNSSSPTVTNCAFSQNVATTDLGGGMYNYNGSSPKVTDCTFTGNEATYGGGMMNYSYSSSPTVTNCTFSGNSATTSGGGMSNNQSSPTVTNCTFSGNSATTSGGGMYTYNGSSPKVTNCTFRGNTATSGGATYSSSVPTVTNCILWGDTPDEIAYSGSAPVVTYSDVQDEIPSDGIVYAGAGNIDTDPRFDEPAGNLRLGSRSPCVDAGNTAVPAGITTDLDGNPRRVDDARVNDTGVGTPPIDMGAYERQLISENVTLYVDDTSSGGTCSSWDDACPDLQTALGLAVSGDDIWVAAGMYKPGTPRTATFQLTTGVAVYGGFKGIEDRATFDLADRDFVADETILSGDLAGDDEDNFVNYGENSHHVVTGSGTDASAVLDGFTITAGNATGSNPDHRGGGMTNGGGSPTVSNCTFTRNLASYGGGMHNFTASSPKVTNCTFSKNKANTRGGGMDNEYGSSPTVTYCTFAENTCTNAGGMWNYQSSPTVTNCTFSGNSATTSGGGMLNDQSSPKVTNCAFSQNVATTSGGGMYNYNGSSPKVTNCTFRGNTADLDGGGMYNQSGTPNVTNCILWGNTPNQIANTAGITPVVTYSDVQDDNPNDGSVYPGVGNIDTEPRFVGAAGGDLRLDRVSPCVDAGNSGAVPAGVITDLDGNPRFVDDADVVDTGIAASNVAPHGLVTQSSTLLAQYGAERAVNGITTDFTHTADGNLDPWWKLDVQSEIRIRTVRYYNRASFQERLYNITTEVLDEAGTVLYTSPVFNPWDGTGSPPNPGLGPFTVDLTAEPGGGVVGTQVRISKDGYLGNEVLSLAEVEVFAEGHPVIDMGAYERQDDSYNVTLYVDDDGPSAGTCSNWADACPDLQTALGQAASGDEIRVAEGTYKPTSGPDPTATFQLLNGVAIRGGYAGLGAPDARDIATYVTTLSGDIGEPGNADNSGSVVTGRFVDATAVLDGFTITEGTGRSENGSTYGGGMFTYASSPTVSNCRFINNTCIYGGGGMYSNGGQPTVVNCTFSGNTATGTGIYGTGGGMWNNGSHATVINCMFSGNTAYNGGGVYNSASATPTVTNCTFSGNTATNPGAAMYNSSSNPTVTNCIVWGNSPPQQQIVGLATTVTYSCVYGGWSEGAGNTDKDPLFVNAPGDLRLRVGSPCIDTGSNAAVPAEVTTDLDGRPRILNGTADMGAYEFIPEIPFDFNHDGDVDAGDLDVFESCSSGPGVPREETADCQTADRDQDNDVDQGDFAAFQRCYSGENVPADPNCSQ